MAAQSQQEGQPKPNPEVGEWENYIGFAVVGLVFSVALITLIQYAALVARYIFSPFVTPVWLVGKAYGTTGSFIVILAYAAICAVIALIFKLALKKKYWYWVSATGLWLLIAMFEIAMGADFSLFTRNMDLFCNPSTIGLGAIFTCENGIDDIAANGVTANIIYSIVPNLVIGWPTFFAIGAGIMKTRSEHPRALMTKIHSIDSLITDQKGQYPHLLFYDKINPNTLPNTAGQMRLMDSSRKFCFENDLVANFTIRPDMANSSNFGKQFGKKPVAPELTDYSFKSDDLVPVIDAAKFEKLMNEQLGEPWAGVENLKPAAVILLAIALPRACCIDGNIDSATAKAVDKAFLIRIKEVWEWAALDISRPETDMRDIYDFAKIEEYRDVIYDWIEHPIAKSFLEEHAYVNTVLFRTLEAAKKLGVMQPSNFRWLKYHDRMIWAIVQNVNRPSGYAENIGTLSHYKEERKAAKRINKPKFQGAYNGLVERAREFAYSEDIIAAWHQWKMDRDPSGLVRLGFVSLDNTEVFGVYTHEEYLAMLESDEQDVYSA